MEPYTQESSQPAVSDIEQLIQVLQTESAVKGREWLQSQLEGKSTSELRQLCTSLGLSRRRANSTSMLTKAELVDQLLPAMSPSLDPWLSVLETT